jgi:hypothetical protein
MKIVDGYFFFQLQHSTYPNFQNKSDGIEMYEFNNDVKGCHNNEIY